MARGDSVLQVRYINPGVIKGTTRKMLLDALQKAVVPQVQKKANKAAADLQGVTKYWQKKHSPKFVATVETSARKVEGFVTAKGTPLQVSVFNAVDQGLEAKSVIDPKKGEYLSFVPSKDFEKPKTEKGRKEAVYSKSPYSHKKTVPWWPKTKPNSLETKPNIPRYRYGKRRIKVRWVQNWPGFEPRNFYDTAAEQNDFTEHDKREMEVKVVTEIRRRLEALK